MTPRVVIKQDRDGTWAWSCDVCRWAGIGLTSAGACTREHVRTAADIAEGKLTPGGFTATIEEHACPTCLDAGVRNFDSDGHEPCPTCHPRRHEA